MSAVREVLRCRPTRFTRFLGVTSRMPPSMKASMALELERGNRLGLPWLGGKVVELGRQLGVPTPTHSLIYAMAKALHHGLD
jgi:2-dehydropantoate 2-reductase